MQVWHQTTGLLCGALIFAGSAGCAIGPHAEPGRNMTGPSEAAPERLVSIGHVFEQQGRLAKADSMYRLALRRDPSNETARRQIAHIASLNRTRTFPATGADDPFESAIVANSRGTSAMDIVTRTVRAPDPPTVPADSGVPDPGVADPGVAELDIASGTYDTPEILHMPEPAASPEPAVAPEPQKLVAVPEPHSVTPTAPSSVSDPGIESYTAPAAVKPSEDDVPVTLYPEPADDVAGEQPVALEPEPSDEPQDQPLHAVADVEIPADFDIVAELDAAFETDGFESTPIVEEQDIVAEIPQPAQDANPDAAFFGAAEPQVASASDDAGAIAESLGVTIQLTDDRTREEPFVVTMIQAVSADDSAAPSDRRGPAKWSATSAETLAAAAQESLIHSYDPGSAPTSSQANSDQVKGVAHLSPARPDTRRSAKPSRIRSVSRSTHRPTGPTRQNITAWINAPEKHVDSLLAALQTGPDNRHRALAATLLAEAPADDRRVNTTLRRFCYDRQAAVAAAAGDSLLARGAVTATPVRRLVSLSEHSNADIRNQVACSMRRLAGTSWESVAIRTLAARLNDTDPAVRGMAALTMGDFPEKPEAILEHLLDRYEVETDNGVRASLELAAQRVASSLADGTSNEQERS